MRLTWHPASLDDASHIGQNLRPGDRREVATITGRNPEIVLMDAAARASRIDGEECYTASPGSGQRAAVIVGVVPTERRGAKVWLLATPEVQQAPVAVLRDSIAWRDRWLEEHGYLWNLVDRRNEMHVRWVRTAGFDLWKTVEINDAPFTYFDISEADDV